MQNNSKQSFVKKFISDIVPGDIVLHPVFRSDGLMLINKNKELSSATINQIRRHVSSHIQLLVVPSSEALKEFLETSDKRDFAENLKVIFKAFSNTIGVSINVHEHFEKDLFLADTTTDGNVIYNVKTNLIIEAIVSSPLWSSLETKLESQILKGRSTNVKQRLLEVLVMDNGINQLIDRMYSYHDVLFIHSINIAMISLLIGLTLELNEEELLDLTLSALFANVGFINISLTDFKHYLASERTNSKVLRDHLLAFSKISSDYTTLRKKTIVYGILDHHEYYNGKGFPIGKAGKDISLFGRILLLAHTYDELVGGYNHTSGLHPFEALKAIFENKDNKFDNDIIKPFFYRTTIFKLGEGIVTSSNERGIIIGFSDFTLSPHLPIVRFDNDKTIDYSIK